MFQTLQRDKEIELKVGEVKRSNSSPNMHLVLVERIRDVIGHVAHRMGQNNDHVRAGGGRGS